MIRISGIQIQQYNQLTTAYEAKAALNMSEILLLEHLATNRNIRVGKVSTSVGEVIMTSNLKTDETEYFLKLTTINGLKFSKTLLVPYKTMTEEQIVPEEQDKVEETKTSDNQEEPKKSNIEN